jgi:hypothetical protein
MYAAALSNFITWDRAVSVHPQSTFIHLRSYITQSKFQSHRYPCTWVNVLEDLGFKIIEEGANTDLQLVSQDVHMQKRFVGDRFTWTLRLDSEG